MNRELLLNEVKDVIAKNINDATCGIFNCRGWMGDTMYNLYYQDGVWVDICYDWNYFEVIGLTAEEFAEVDRFYEELKNRKRV